MSLQKLLARPSIFFVLTGVLTWFQMQFFLKQVILVPGSVLGVLFILCFGVLALNISILAVQAFFACFVKSPSFLEAKPFEVRHIPVALIYCTRNESFGVKERMIYTFRNNFLPGTRLWILSDSDASFEGVEQEWVSELREEFGNENVFYRRRKVLHERKQGNVKEWMASHGTAYKYFVVCDADSLLPPGWLGKMLRVAEHPAQERVGVFQSAVYITHESSLYARMQAIGQYYAQRLYFHVNQAVLGRSIAFGHNCLIRREAFEKVKLPAGILSHDNWETGLLEREGYLTAFLSEIPSYEEATPHYLEDRKRAGRWLKGTLQGVPLLWMSGISLPARFILFYQVYMYFTQPVLMAWILMGFWLNAGQYVFFEAGRYAGFLLIFTLSVLYLHKFAVARSWHDVKRIAAETVFSTLLGLQNIFYGTLDFLTLPLKGLGWKPMDKDPGAQPSFHDCVRMLLPGSVAGLLGFVLGLSLAPQWLVYVLPVLLSLIVSIPAVYWSSQPWRRSP